MHRKFLIFGRVFCALGALSFITTLVIYFLDITVTFPAVIAYPMLISELIAVLCLLIGFVLDIMSHLIRKDMSAIMWLFAIAIVVTVIQMLTAVGNWQNDYMTMFYNGFVVAAGLRGLWYIIGIRQYEIDSFFK